jgi:toxin ParE1/3/4
VKPVILHEEAEAELEGSIAFYENRRRGLGIEFHEEVAKAIQQLQGNPSMFPIHREDIRKCRVRRFPFTIFFQELEEVIWITAVAHQKRKPDYWSDRFP